MLLPSLLPDHNHICTLPDPPQTHTQGPFIPGKPHSPAGFIDVPMQGISAPGSHYKAGMAREMGGRDGHRFLHGTPGMVGEAQAQGAAPALPCRAPCATLCPAEPTRAPAAPQSHRGAAESTESSTALIWWLPTQFPALLCSWNPTEGPRGQISADSPPEPPHQGISGH